MKVFQYSYLTETKNKFKNRKVFDCLRNPKKHPPVEKLQVFSSDRKVLSKFFLQHAQNSPNTSINILASEDELICGKSLLSKSPKIGHIKSHWDTLLSWTIYYGRKEFSLRLSKKQFCQEEWEGSERMFVCVRERGGGGAREASWPIECKEE